MVSKDLKVHQATAHLNGVQSMSSKLPKEDRFGRTCTDPGYLALLMGTCEADTALASGPCVSIGQKPPHMPAPNKGRGQASTRHQPSQSHAVQYQANSPEPPFPPFTRIFYSAIRQLGTGHRHFANSQPSELSHMSRHDRITTNTSSSKPFT